MKRHPSLQRLSDDHHRALVLARRLRRDSGELDVAGLAVLEREVRREFEGQLEPHFRIEESWLLPALEGKGETRLVEQTLQDHTRMGALVGGLWSGETARELGKLLEKHVRFEERVLFPRAEALLSESDLAAVRDAGIEEGAGPRCSS